MGILVEIDVAYAPALSGRADISRSIKTVCVVHDETSTGITNDIPAIRGVLDETQHPTLLMVDTVSGLGSIDYRHYKWNVDVSIAGSQNGLMLTPGLGLTAVSTKALAALKHARLPRSYWDWEPMLQTNENGFWPSTPSTKLLFGLEESPDMLADKGLTHIIGRHERVARTTRAAVDASDLETVCLDPDRHSPAHRSWPRSCYPKASTPMPFRAQVLRRFDMSLGAGLASSRAAPSGWPLRLVQRPDAAQRTRRHPDGLRCSAQGRRHRSGIGHPSSRGGR